MQLLSGETRDLAKIGVMNRRILVKTDRESLRHFIISLSTVKLNSCAFQGTIRMEPEIPNICNSYLFTESHSFV